MFSSTAAHPGLWGAGAGRAAQLGGRPLAAAADR